VTDTIVPNPRTANNEDRPNERMAMSPANRLLLKVGRD
jgi:hypothetical protein